MKITIEEMLDFIEYTSLNSNWYLIDRSLFMILMESHRYSHYYH